MNRLAPSTIPIYAPLAEIVDSGQPLPAQVRREHALGRAEDCAPLVVFLASEAGAEVTGQAIGMGGDRLTLYSHPDALLVADRDGGWSAEQIASAWAEKFAASRQRSGIQLPPVQLDVAPSS